MSNQKNFFSGPKPFLYFGLMALAFAYVKKSSFVFVAGLIFIVCTLVIYEVRRAYLAKKKAAQMPKVILKNSQMIKPFSEFRMKNARMIEKENTTETEVSK